MNLDLDLHNEYWRRYLGEPKPSDALGLRCRRGGDEGAVSHRRVEVRGRIDEPRIDAAGDTASQLQAAWWLLLWRLNGCERFVGGWLQGGGRDERGAAQGVLPIVVAPVPSLAFAAWSRELGTTWQAHLEAGPPAQPPAHAGRATFAFASEAFEPGGGAELMLQGSRSAHGLELRLSADALRFDEPALRCLLDQFSALLRHAAANPQAPLAELSPIGEAERASLLSMRGPVRDFGRAHIGERIADWARGTPEAAAIEEGEQSLSYRALDARVACVAAWMAERGVARGALVALNLPRSTDLVVAMLAAWRLGASYLPLEPAWPPARRDALLHDSRVAHVFDALPPSSDPTAALPARGSEPQDPHEPAYVLYTSGSTGRPKGVSIGHAALSNYVAAASEAMSLASCRRWALTSSVAADLGNTALFGALFNGACLVIAHDDDVKDAAAFARFVEHRRIDALKIVPSHLEALLEHDAPRLPATVVLGGEPASARLVERVRAVAPATRLFNHYGPTETTVGVMVHRIAIDAAAATPQPLTEVLANNQVRVLDGDLRLVPVGTVGELYIGGAQLCRGYLNRDVGGVFVDDPFAPGERLYRTGDLAWVRPQGGVVLAGRADHQLKLRGYRVDPAEVEAALLALPGVRHAVALGSHSAGATVLVAFVTGDADAASLRARLEAVLPPHMVPSRCVVVPTWPRLPNGKVDRQALASLIDRDSGVRDQSAPPVDEIESAVTGQLKALLQRDAIDVDDDIFELGMHSLLVIRLAARLRRQLGVEFAPALVFDHPTVASLSRALAAVRAEASA